MKKVEEFQSEIAEWLLTLKARNGVDMAPQSTRDKWHKVLNKIVPVLIQNGHETPDAKDYEEFRANNTMSDETFETYKEKIEQFFSWSKNKERRQEPMTDEMIEQSTENETVLEAETVDAEHESVHDEEITPKEKESNAGRKPLDKNGTKRNQKLMLYLTPRMIEDVRDWCHLKNLSSNDYITKLIEADLRDKQAKLSSFRQLRDEA